MSRRFGSGRDPDYHDKMEEHLEAVREDPPHWEGADAHDAARSIEEWSGWSKDPDPALSEAYWRLFEELNP